jgi:hypothetical protein
MTQISQMNAGQNIRSAHLPEKSARICVICGFMVPWQSADK